MRIATVYWDGTTNAHYRVHVPLRALEQRGHEILWPAVHPLERTLSGKPRFDVYLVQQMFDPEEIELVGRLREQGVAVVWDTDDDISAIPRYSPAFANYSGKKWIGGRRGLRQTFERTVAIARASSLMTTPSPHLADLYRDHGVEHVEVIENYVAPEDTGRPRPRHVGVVIGCTAAYEHRDDLKQLGIAGALERILQKHPGVRVVMIGWDLGLRDSRYRNVASVPYSQLIATEREFDIGIAPLTPSRFGLARSNVKVKEYAAAGAMWLASPVGPFVGLGEAQGGLLVEDGDWFEVLDELVENYRRRMQLIERARTWAREQSGEHAARIWEAAFKRAIQRVRAGTPT
jgi:glycosyltransferase involved in cell wall biosynthesis